MAEYSWPAKDKTHALGKRVKRLDGMAKATGAAKYTYDVNLKNQLIAKGLGSPHASATIKSIDVAPALKVAGVVEAMPLKKSGDKVEFQGFGADDAFGDIGRHLRGLFRPGHPDHAVALDRRFDIAEAILDLGALPGEGMDGIVFLGRSRNLRPIGQPVDLSEIDRIGEVIEFRRQRDEGRDHPVLQAELGRKGRAGIA